MMHEMAGEAPTMPRLKSAIRDSGSQNGRDRAISGTNCATCRHSLFCFL